MQQQVEEIWKDLHQELEKFILHKVKNVEICQDLLQDVFIKIQLNIHTLSDSSKLTSWIYQLTRNTIADYYRKTNFDAQINDFQIAENENEEPLYSALSDCINSKISKLPKKYKQAILLTYFDNKSQKDLANDLNISYSGAKSRVQRAKEILKDNVTECPKVISDKSGKIIDFD